jgi:hypothetical protein
MATARSGPPVEAVVDDLRVEVRVRTPRSAADLSASLDPGEANRRRICCTGWRRSDSVGKWRAASGVSYALDTNTVVAALNGVPSVLLGLFGLHAIVTFSVS